MWPWFNSNPLMMPDNSKKLSASEAGDDLIGDETEKLSKSDKPNNVSGK